VVSAPLQVSLGALFVGLVAGGLLGTFRYESLENQRPLCGTCHHGASEIADAADRIPPHSLDFGASCHVCHVIPLREYVAFWLGSTERTPEWQNPTIGGQTCLEFHLERSRGTLPCEGCHSEALAGVRLTEECQTCHLDRELVQPHHGKVVCRDCHVETYLDPRERAKGIMAAKLAGELPPLPKRNAPPPSPQMAGGVH
jgi:hypothetical protein